MPKIRLLFLIISVLLICNASLAYDQLRNNSNFSNKQNQLIISIKEALIDYDSFILSPSLDEIDIIIDKGKIAKIDFDNAKSFTSNIVNLDKKTKKFSSTSIITMNNNKTYQLDLQGKFEEFSYLPVFKNTVKHNQIIQEDDLDEARLNIAKISNNAIHDRNQIIGKRLKRPLYPYRAINRDDIAEPLIIDKGNSVTIIYNNNNLLIKMSGVALEPGARGDTIKIKNTRSNSIINAVIDDENTAHIPTSP